MKTTFKSLMVFAVVYVMASCTYNEYLIESDYSYQGQFKNYKTFAFVTDDTSTGVDSDTARMSLEEAIVYRLELIGHKYDPTNPNLLVSYKVFYGDFGFRGYNQPVEEQWIRYQDEEILYEPVDYALKRGTLLVLLYDKKKEQSVWQGYASGVFNEESLQDERYIKRIIRSIFDRYRFFAEGFDAKGRATAIAN